jgi:hypothetical protein
MKELLDLIFSDFKWYRKKSGGHWRKVYDRDSDLGIAGDTVHWTQDLSKEPAAIEVIEEEKYSA